MFFKSAKRTGISFQEAQFLRFFFLLFPAGCPQVSKKADLTHFPRRRARKALPPNLFLLFIGWWFIENVELHLISSAFGLACSSAASPPAAPPKLSARKSR